MLMDKKTMSTVGIEYDSMGIRAAKISSSIAGREINYALENLQEVKGDFEKDAELIDGLKKIRDKIGMGLRDKIVTCVAGKQVYATQIEFKNIPDAEMKNALKFEIRKDAPFDTSSSSLDYQVLETGEDKQNDKSSILVTVVANTLLNKHLSVLQKANIKPWVVDVLPLAVINSFWAGENDPLNLTPRVILHFAPDVCTLVIDGNSLPLYTRSIYFASEEMYGATDKGVNEQERMRRITLLGNEVRRSLSFYEKTYGVSNFGTLHLIGDYIYSPELHGGIAEKVGLELAGSTLLEKLNVKTNAPLGKFDVAIALGMRRE
jgi:Tfp pilus assembly PilM family ATPase